MSRINEPSCSANNGSGILRSFTKNMNATLAYYAQNASKFSQDTWSVEFSDTQNRFLNLLHAHPFILDFGCGSGRDTIYFLSKGCKVEACDGSAELCRIASCNTGIKVTQKLFSELNSSDIYDGIWACASILHLPEDELKDVLHKIHTALKDNGVLYTSFKYGEFEGMRTGRYFHDFTFESFKMLLDEVGGFSVIEHWISEDVRSDKKDEKWLNLLLRRED